MRCDPVSSWTARLGARTTRSDGCTASAEAHGREQELEQKLGWVGAGEAPKGNRHAASEGGCGCTRHSDTAAANVGRSAAIGAIGGVVGGTVQ